jgi:hypothetical protein
MPIKIQRRPLPIETISNTPAVQPVQKVAQAGPKAFTLRDYMTTRGNGSVPRAKQGNAIQGFKCGGLNKK